MIKLCSKQRKTVVKNHEMKEELQLNTNYKAIPFASYLLFLIIPFYKLIDMLAKSYNKKNACKLIRKTYTPT